MRFPMIESCLSRLSRHLADAELNLPADVCRGLRGATQKQFATSASYKTIQNLSSQASSVKCIRYVKHVNKMERFKLKISRVT